MMDDPAYAAVCMMCGRNLGHLSQGRFFARPDGATLERQGQTLRCGYCYGRVLLEAVPALEQPDWIARMKEEEAASGSSRRAYRRRAV